MNRIKRFDEVDLNESINESWKSWAVALGIASASLLVNDALGQSKLKDKIELVKDKLNGDPVLKKLIEDGYEPLPGALPLTRLEVYGEGLIDSDISVLSNTLSGAMLSLKSALEERKIKPEEDGYFVYKKEGSKVRLKWITSETRLQKIKMR